MKKVSFCRLKLSSVFPVIDELNVNEDQFEQMVRDHQTLVFRSIVRLVGNNDRVEDLAQEVFLRLYRGMQHFRGDSKISTYLYRIILNVVADEWKRRKGERANLSSFADPDENWENRLAHPSENAEQILRRKQLLETVERGLAQLSDAERSVLVLYHQEDCSYEQIATVMSIPVGTVRTHLHRGREKLKLALREKWMRGRKELCEKAK